MSSDDGSAGTALMCNSHIAPPQFVIELLPAMLSGEDTATLRLYILLIGLSHSTRQAVRGTLRQMSFDDMEASSLTDDNPEDRLPTPTAAALAALVGPCLGLVKLTLPSCEPGLWSCGHTVDDCAPWVDEAFTGHVHLTTLRIPVGNAVMTALPRILGHLPGLVDFQLTLRRRNPTPVLSALAQCPHLEAVHLATDPYWEFIPTLLVPDPSSPLLTRLKRLSLLNAIPRASHNLVHFFRLLPHLEQLRLSVCNDEALACIGPRLTLLRVPRNQACQLSSFQFGQLETIEIENAPNDQTPIVNMLRANQATIHSFSWDCCRLSVPLFDALASCPALTHLDLVTGPGGCQFFDFSHMSTDLLGRLESLRLHEAESGILHARGPITSDISIASTTLRSLHLDMNLNNRVALDCPALEVLTLPTAVDSSYRLVLNCPRLRQIAGLPEEGPTECQAMPHLAGVRYANGSDPCVLSERHRAALDAILAGSPAITRLSGVRLGRFDDLAKLLQTAPALCHLAAKIAVAPDAGDIFLTTDHLESLDLSLIAAAAADDDERLGESASVNLRVEASHLRFFSLSDNCSATRVRSLAVHCPALVDLTMSQMQYLTTFTLVTASTSLRSLLVDGCAALDPSCLLSCLRQHGGSGLRRVFLGGLPPCVSWPELAAALGSLPRLRDLRLGDRPTSDLCLSCPTTLLLNCPLLEELWAPLGDEMKFEVSGAENRHLRGRVSPEWVSVLKVSPGGRRGGCSCDSLFCKFQFAAQPKRRPHQHACQNDPLSPRSCHCPSGEPFSFLRVLLLRFSSTLFFMSRAKKEEAPLDTYQRVALALLNADYVLITADQGFEDPPPKPKPQIAPPPPTRPVYQMDPEAPRCLAEADPERFYGYWGKMYNDAMDLEADPTVHILLRWLRHFLAIPADERRAVMGLSKKKKSGGGGGRKKKGEEEVPPPATNAFVYTTLRTHMFHRVGFPPEAVCEVDGNVLSWQCNRPCAPQVFQPPATFRFKLARVGPSLRAPRFVVDDDHSRQEAAREARKGSTAVPIACSLAEPVLNLGLAQMAVTASTTFSSPYATTSKCMSALATSSAAARRRGGLLAGIPSLARSCPSAAGVGVGVGGVMFAEARPASPLASRTPSPAPSPPGPALSRPSTATTTTTRFLRPASAVSPGLLRADPNALAAQQPTFGGVPVYPLMPNPHAVSSFEHRALTYPGVFDPAPADLAPPLSPSAAPAPQLAAPPPGGDVGAMGNGPTASPTRPGTASAAVSPVPLRHSQASLNRAPVTCLPYHLPASLGDPSLLATPAETSPTLRARIQIDPLNPEPPAQLMLPDPGESVVRARVRTAAATGTSSALYFPAPTGARAWVAPPPPSLLIAPTPDLAEPDYIAPLSTRPFDAPVAPPPTTPSPPPPAISPPLSPDGSDDVPEFDDGEGGADPGMLQQPGGDIDIMGGGEPQLPPSPGDDSGGGPLIEIPTQIPLTYLRGASRVSGEAPEFSPLVPPHPSGQTSSSVPRAFNYLRCPLCNRDARPNVRMKFDKQWVSSNTGMGGYTRWMEGLKAEFDRDKSRVLVVLELGSRSAKIRTANNTILKEIGSDRCTLVRIGPGLPPKQSASAADSSLIQQRRIVSEALRVIDAHIGAMAAAKGMAL
ncbi:hypothetical protein PAPYR_4065 [Paratrimastix pyriformis]|uniref:Uncharacterized protein n=1 Tax=Paratrimastix pyriformis TaxID=342808 RepID=A0ABQ8ULA5_9EUKA|nr:hypothetical protein PAPYR_4065 [Paratrimastix pyriformis]